MWFYSSCFFELSLFPVIFSINNSYMFHVEQGPVVFICCGRPVIFLLSLRFFSIIFIVFHVTFNFLHISTVFQLYNYSLLYKLPLKFPFYPFVFFRICPLKSFWFCKDCCYLLGTPFSYDTNTFNGSSSLLFCSELWVWKMFLIVLLITFNGFQFNCMIFLIYDISLFNHVWSLQTKFTLLTRVLIVDNFTCSSWFDKKWV